MATRVPSRGRSTALVRIPAATLIKGFAIAVWFIGYIATVWLGSQAFPNVETGRLLLGAAVAQLILTLGQLRVVRAFFGGLPTFFFAIDTATNFLAGVDIFYTIDYSAGAAFLGSLLAIVSVPLEALVFRLAFLALIGFVAYKIATTPERVIDTSAGGEA